MNKIGNYQELRNALAQEADDEYREFVMRGIPSDRPFLGVRIPQVREVTKLISPEHYDEFLQHEPVAFEEVLARGFLIASLPYSEMLKHFDLQINYIDDWCTCDTFCSSLKSVKKHKSDFFDLKIDRLLNNPREFAVRVGLVLLKCYYVDFDWLGVIFDRAESLRARDEYYIKMAIAWLLAECFIKFPAETFAYLEASKLPKWTYNKTISKICDSYRVTPEAKDILKRMRR